MAYDRLLTAAWLRARYVDAGRTVESLAREADVCTQTIYRALARHGIAVRVRDRTGAPYSLGEILTEAFLRERYQDQQQSVRAVATEVGCSESAVMARLRRYDIPRRGVQPADKLILSGRVTREVLANARAIAAELSVDEGTVRAYLSRHEVE